MFYYFLYWGLFLSIYLAQRRISFLALFFSQEHVHCQLGSYAISAEWRLKDFINISLYNFIPVLQNTIHNTVFYTIARRKPIYFSKFRQKQAFWTFWKLIFVFSLKEETMRNIYNRNVAKLGTCFVDTQILVGYFFSFGILKPSLLQLI